MMSWAWAGAATAVHGRGEPRRTGAHVRRTQFSQNPAFIIFICNSKVIGLRSCSMLRISSRRAHRNSSAFDGNGSSDAVDGAFPRFHRTRGSQEGLTTCASKTAPFTNRRNFTCTTGLPDTVSGILARLEMSESGSCRRNR